jgi:hypothetical protein
MPLVDSHREVAAEADNLDIAAPAADKAVARWEDIPVGDKEAARSEDSLAVGMVVARSEDSPVVGIADIVGIVAAPEVDMPVADQAADNS